ncbi:MAG: thioredoxin family protein [Cocleimonas sp.]
MSFVDELDEFTFFPKLEDSSGISMIFFTGPHCASCHHLKFLLNAEHTQFTEHYAKSNTNFSAYEIKADKAAALVNEFGVFHLPSMYLYKEGEFHCELHSEATPSKLIEAIDLALSLPAQEEP